MAAATRLFDERGPHVPLDDVARAAGVANATLYRHFPTRPDLLAAVYAGEVEALDALSARLARRADAESALTEWLRAFVRHVAAKRELALAMPDRPGDGRDAQFARWHDAMFVAADRLVARAKAVGVVRPDLAARDLLLLVGAVALTGGAEDRTDALLELVRRGYAGTPRRR